METTFSPYEASRQAVARALNGDGPSLIECQTYRIGFHNTSDNPSLYRDVAEVDAAVELDPIDRLRRYALATRIYNETDLVAVKEEVVAEVDAAYKRVNDLPRAGPEAVFEHVYADLPPRVSQQRAEIIEGCKRKAR